MRKLFSGALLMLILFLLIAGVSFSHGVTTPIVDVVSVQTGKQTFDTWNPTYYFYKNEWLTLAVALQNNDNANRTATVYLNTLDELSQPIGTLSLNIDLMPNETKTIYAPIYLPTWAYTGNGKVTAFAKTLPEGTYSLQVTGTFYLSRATASYLQMRTSSKGEMSTDAWIDGINGFAPATVELDPGQHTLQVQSVVYGWYSGTFYKYTFKSWENGLQSTSRILDSQLSTNQTVTAYYYRERSIAQPLSASSSPA